MLAMPVLCRKPGTKDPTRLPNSPLSPSIARYILQLYAIIALSRVAVAGFDTFALIDSETALKFLSHGQSGIILIDA